MLAPARNPRAVVSAVTGLLALAAVPATIAYSYYTDRITLVQAAASGIVAALLGLYAILQARRARDCIARTLGRARGRVALRLGLVLGVAGICLAAAAGIAVGFYELLRIYG